mmetsp:Transcript_46459/g.92242  ORF Transcript_46459/g.92242 Transcript_46459/m.92242 type:complete len:172 (+) Transcript_46459:61-576(+)
MSDAGGFAAKFAEKVLQRDKWVVQPGKTDKQEARKAASQSISTRAAFQAALAKFQNLERGTDDAPQVRTCSFNRPTQRLKAVATERPTPNGGGSTSVEQGDACSDHQQKLKFLVAGRFAALVREGLEPNEAAARAILEAAGRQGESEEPQLPRSDSPKRGWNTNTAVAVTA